MRSPSEGSPVIFNSLLLVQLQPYRYRATSLHRYCATTVLLRYSATFLRGYEDAVLKVSEILFPRGYEDTVLKDSKILSSRVTKIPLKWFQKYSLNHTTPLPYRFDFRILFRVPLSLFLTSLLSVEASTLLNLYTVQSIAQIGIRTLRSTSNVQLVSRTKDSEGFKCDNQANQSYENPSHYRERKEEQKSKIFAKHSFTVHNTQTTTR